MQGRAIKRGYSCALLPPVLERIHGIVKLDGYTASIQDANDSTHGTARLMRRDFWSLVDPLVAAQFGAPAKPAGRTDFLLCVIRYATAPPAGDMGLLVHFAH
jgi:hypothetical protein